MLDAFLHAARASVPVWFVWFRVARPLFYEATPRAMALVSPHISRFRFSPDGGLGQPWLAAASAVEYTEEVAQCMVDTLSGIASKEELLPLVTIGVWS